MSDNGPVESGNPGESAGPWYAGVQDEGLRGFAELKGWKEPGDALKSYKELETFVGAPKERLIKLPSGNEAWDDVWAKLGRPAKAEDYGLKIEGAEEKDLSVMAQQMHKLGLSKAQATEFAKWMGEAAKAGAESSAAAKAAEEKAAIERKTQEFESYKAERGDKWGEEYALAQRAFKFAGGSEDELVKLEDALGIRRTLELFTRLGAGFREDGLAGNPGPVATTSASAKAQIASLQNDSDFTKRLIEGDVTAMQKWQSLINLAAQS